MLSQEQIMQLIYPVTVNIKGHEIILEMDYFKENLNEDGLRETYSGFTCTEEEAWEVMQARYDLLIKKSEDLRKFLETRPTN